MELNLLVRRKKAQKNDPDSYWSGKYVDFSGVPVHFIEIANIFIPSNPLID